MSLFRLPRGEDLIWDAGCNQYVWAFDTGFYPAYSDSILTHSCPSGQIAYFKIPARNHHKLIISGSSYRFRLSTSTVRLKMIPSKGKIKIESGFDSLTVGSFDEDNQILDFHSFGQGYIAEMDFFSYPNGQPIIFTMQNEDGSFYQDGYKKSFTKLNAIP